MVSLHTYCSPYYKFFLSNNKKHTGNYLAKGSNTFIQTSIIFDLCIPIFVSALVSTLVFWLIFINKLSKQFIKTYLKT